MPAIDFVLTQEQFDALQAEALKNGGATGADATAYCKGLCERQADSILTSMTEASLAKFSAVEKKAILDAITTGKVAGVTVK